VTDRHPFLARLARGPLVADGAMGTVLYARGVPYDDCFEAQNLHRPDLVRGIHVSYLEAGAELLETNTFGANRLKLTTHGLAEDLDAINAAGVRLAREAVMISGREAWVAGSIGPLGRQMAPIGALSEAEALEVFGEQARALTVAGADLIVLETFFDLTEMTAAVRAVQGATSVPIIAQMTFAQDGRTLLGYTPEEVVERLEALGVAVIGANCSLGPQGIVEVLERMASVAGTPLSAMPNAGLPAYVGGRFAYLASPAYVADHAVMLIEAGVAIVGGCCGTTPEHIAAVRETTAGRRLGTARPRPAAPAPPPKVPAPVLEPGSSFAQKLAGRAVITVEVAPPRGADDAEALENCRRLRVAGVDAVDVADNPMARLRMSPWATAARIEREVGLETILHFTTRDRNLIRLQSDLLAVHALGIRNVLVLRGDHPQAGDYPQATAVSDIHPSGLVRMIKEFNQGRDVAGNPIGEPTRFTIGIALNLAPRDPGREMRGFEKKLAAGGDFICTMPIFDPDTLDAFLTRYGLPPIPMLVGVLPLHSARHAEFLHNELPGMIVPDAIRAQLRGARDGRTAGLDLARELVRAIRDRAAGMYMVPSFGRYDRIIELVRMVRAPLAAR
jgi:methionine synthase I (cobalamin-dependent)/5,10-methylenetetrahydrofolate reductase